MALTHGTTRWVTGHLMEDSEAFYFCDTANFEILMRFQRAALRPEVVARPATELAPAIARWQGFDLPADAARASAEDRLADALSLLRGYSAPVKAWLNDFLPARYAAADAARADEALQLTGLTWFGTASEQMTIAYPQGRPVETLV